MKRLLLALALSAGLASPARALEWGRADSVRTWALRLVPGDDPRAEIERFARQQDIRAGYVVTCVGSLSRAALRLANQPNTTTYDGHFEIVSLTGTFGAGGLHLHASLADSTGRVFGGHLSAGSRVYTTAEIVLAEAAGLVFGRAPDPTTGYRELKVARDSLSVRALVARAFLDHANARHLADDSRVWYERCEGPGEPRDRSGHEAWSDWDAFFHARKSYEFAGAGADSAVWVLTEDNDFYGLIERAPSRVRLTFWFDDRDRIAGTLVEGIPSDPTSPDRLPEFEAWLGKRHPAALADLLPGGRIAHDGAHARRWRDALERWRRDRQPVELPR